MERRRRRRLGFRKGRLLVLERCRKSREGLDALDHRSSGSMDFIRGGFVEVEIHVLRVRVDIPSEPLVSPPQRIGL